VHSPCAHCPCAHGPHARSLQLAPVHPAKQKHLPALHAPRPLHSSGQPPVWAGESDEPNGQRLMVAADVGATKLKLSSRLAPISAVGWWPIRIVFSDSAGGPSRSRPPAPPRHGPGRTTHADHPSTLPRRAPTLRAASAPPTSVTARRIRQRMSRPERTAAAESFYSKGEARRYEVSVVARMNNMILRQAQNSDCQYQNTLRFC
jgi:hypothetical protein